MKKLYLLLLALVCSVGMMWGEDVTLFSCTFSSLTSGTTNRQKTSIEQTIDGCSVKFIGGSTSKSVTWGGGNGLNFGTQNASTGSSFHGIAIMVSNVNEELYVTINDSYNTAKASYKYAIVEESTISTPSSLAQISQAQNTETSILITKPITGTDAVVYIGENSSNYTTINSIVIKTKQSSAPTNKTIYYVNTNDWTTVKAYMWEAADDSHKNADWSGEAMTKVDGVTVTGHDVYSYEYAANATFDKVIFNDGGSNQTANLDLETDKYYFKDAWKTKAEIDAIEKRYQEEQVAISLVGNFNNWDVLANKFVDGELSIEFEANKDYPFQIYDYTKYYGCTGAPVMTKDNTSNPWDLSTGYGYDNITLHTELAGEYKFAWDGYTHKLTVTYPVQKYAVNFAAGGGKGSMDAVLYAAGEEVTLPECTFTAPTGKEFDAWTSTDVTITDGKFTMPAKEITVTATWTAKPVVNTGIKSTVYTPSGSNMAVETTLVDDANITVYAKFAVTEGSTSKVIQGDTYTKYAQFGRAKSVSNTGTYTEQTGNSPLEITCKKSGVFMIRYRRQCDGGSTYNSFTSNNGKDVALSVSGGNTKMAGDWELTSTEDDGKGNDGAYGCGVKQWNVEAGTSYLLWATGTTIQSYGFVFTPDCEVSTYAGDSHFATLYLDYDAKIPTGVNAYTGKYNDGVVKLRKVTDVIPANTAVVLVSEEGASATFTKNLAKVTPIDENDLSGSCERTLTATLKGAKNTFMALNGNSAAFNSYNGEYFPANRAYLAIDLDTPAPLRVEIPNVTNDPIATDVEHLNAHVVSKVMRAGKIYILRDSKLYDLNGRLVK